MPNKAAKDTVATVRVLASKPFQRVSFPSGHSVIADKDGTFVIPEVLFKRIEHLKGYTKIAKNWTAPVKKKKVNRTTTVVNRPEKKVFIPASSQRAHNAKKAMLGEEVVEDTPTAQETEKGKSAPAETTTTEKGKKGENK